MCAMMSCWEGEGWWGGGHIEMLMSPHSGGDSWRGTEDGVMSPRYEPQTEKSDGGRDAGVRGTHSGRSMPPGCVCVCVCVCVCTPALVCVPSPLTDELKRATESD